MTTLEYGFTAKQITDEGRVSVEDIEEIKYWLPSATNVKLTDEQVVLFLLSSGNQLEPTKRTIQAYLTLFKEFPELVTHRSIEREDLRKHAEIWDIFVVPERMDDGSVIIFSRLHDTDFRKLEMAATLTLLSMILDATFYDYPPTGLIFVCDMTGVGLLHMTRIKIKLLRFFFRFVQDALPIQMKQVHVLNTVYFIDKLVGIMKPFANSKLLKMINFHPSNTNMELFAEKWIPRRCLPEDYGGYLSPVRVLHGRSIEKLKQMRPFFEAEDDQRRCLYT